MARHPIGYIGILFAVILFFAGIYAEGYSTSEYVGPYPFGYAIRKYPYKEYSFPLVLCGILCFTAGVVALYYKFPERESDVHSQVTFLTVKRLAKPHKNTTLTLDTYLLIKLQIAKILLTTTKQ